MLQTLQDFQLYPGVKCGKFCFIANHEYINIKLTHSFEPIFGSFGPKMGPPDPKRCQLRPHYDLMFFSQSRGVANIKTTIGTSRMSICQKINNFDPI